MSQTKIRQSSQIFNSDVYDDGVAAGATLESGSVSLQQDLNALRSQMNRLQGGTNWYDALSGRSVETLSTDLLAVEEKPLLYRFQKLSDVAVPNGQSYVVLNVAGGEAPSGVVSVGAVSTEGVVAAFSASFDAPALDIVAGPTALNPRNLCIIRDANTGDPLLSGGKQVYGLMQSESNVDGHVFDDTTSRAQITFVRENADGDGLELVPVADVENQTINYAYVNRVFFGNLPQDAYLMGVFVDASSGGGGSDLQSVIDAQGNSPVSSNNDTTIGFGASTYGWTFNHPNGGFTEFGYDNGFKHRVGSFPENFTVELGGVSTQLVVGDSNLLATYFSILNGPSGAVVNFSANDWAVSHNTAATFSGELRAGADNNYVSLGRFGDARVESEGGQDLIVKGSAELLLDDGYKDSSSWGGSANGVPLADSIAEWTAYSDAFGNASLLASISSVNRQKSVAVVTSPTVAANTDLQSGTNIDAALSPFNSSLFLTAVDVYLNGQLMRNGADAAANFDVYPGTDPASGELKFEFGLVAGDVITVINHGVV
jgi:hypothetical protein